MIEAMKNMCAFSIIKQNNSRQKTKFTVVPNCQTPVARKKLKKVGWIHFHLWPLKKKNFDKKRPYITLKAIQANLHNRA